MRLSDAPYDRRRRRLRLAVATGWAMTIGLAGVVSLPAAAVGAAVTIDDLGGTVHGTRSVTGFIDPVGGTTAPGSFVEEAGWGRLALTGDGAARSGVRLDYEFRSTDLGSGSAGSQLILELDSVVRVPKPLADDAVSLSIAVTDATGRTGSYVTGLDNLTDGAVTVDLSCAGGGPCLSPRVDSSRVTGVQVDFSFPRNGEGGSTTVVLDAIRTARAGGAPPPAPTPTITAPIAASAGGPVYGDNGTTLAYTVDFVSAGVPVAVDGFTPSDLTVGGTAPGRNTVAIRGGPVSYTVEVGPLTGAGSVTLQIVASGVVDDWAQDNLASRISAVDFVIPVPPELTSPDPPAGAVGAAYDFVFAASGVPAATYAVTAGILPPGLSLDSASGSLAGTPTVAGDYPFTVSADNRAGSAGRAVTVSVDQAPEITSPGRADFVLGSAGEFVVSAIGRPAPALTLAGALPRGLSFVDHGDGTGSISGTPIQTGDFAMTVAARSPLGEADQTLTIAVNQGAAISSPDTTTFRVGERGSFEIVAGGVPPAALSIDSGLPDGLTLTDHGDGTATLAGAPTTGGVSDVTVTAANHAGTIEQRLRIVVEQTPALTSAEAVSYRVGQAAAFTVTSRGYPVPVIQTSSPLPPGLTLTDNGNGTATIGGTPTGQGGSSRLALTATNSIGTTGATLRLAVHEDPAITSPATATFMLGTAAAFDVTATGFPAPTISAGALPPGLTLVDNGDGSATISGTPTGVSGLHPVALTATSSVDSTVQVLQLAVNEKPEITSGSDATFRVGSPGSFTVTTTGYPDPLIIGDGDLPAGLRLVDNRDGTATIAGTPAAPGGTTQLNLRVTNMSGSSAQSFTVRVVAAPSFVAATSAGFVVGVVGTHTVRTAGFPVPEISAATLPAGLTLTDNGDGTATIAGSPTGPAVSSTLTLAATNSVDSVTTRQTIEIATAPVFVGDPTASFTRGEAGSVQILTDGAPDAAIGTSDPLPAGLTLSDNGDGTATLGGMPTADGETELTMSAVNAAGTTEQQLTVQVRSAPAFTSGNAARFTVADEGSFTISATGFPAPGLSLDGALPKGLAFVDGADGTATIVGTPQVGTAGRFIVTIRADQPASPDQSGRITAADAAAVESTVTITVAEAETAASAGATASPDPLPGTGGRSAWLIALAGLLIAAGSAVLAAQRFSGSRRGRAGARTIR